MVTHVCKCTNKRLPDNVLEIANDEMIVYIGILLILGITKKENVDITEIWSPNSMNYLDYVTLTMPRTKFQNISRYITFDDIETRGREDSKFHKMQQHIFYQVQKKIVNATKSNTHTCVDETLYAFRGKWPFRTLHAQQTFQVWYQIFLLA